METKIFFAGLQKKLSSNGPALFCYVMALFIILLVASIIHTNSSIKSEEIKLEELLNQCEIQQVENDALKELIENSDDEYIERKAREMGYVKPGERVYLVRSGN